MSERLEFNHIDGDKLRVLRRQRRMTQAKLSVKADISAPHLSRLERGRHTAHDGTLESLAAALGVEPDELLVEGVDGQEDGGPPEGRPNQPALVTA